MRHSSTFGPGALTAGVDRPALELPKGPGVETAYLVAGGLMEILGPLFWAILIVGFLFAEF